MVNLKVVQGDARNLWELPDSSIDLIFTSPPYYKVKQYDENPNNIGNIGDYKGYLDSMEEAFKECFRVLKEGCFCIINISTVRDSSHVYPIAFHFYNILTRVGFNYQENVIWEKNVNTNDMRFGVTIQNPKPRWYYPNNIYEYTLIFMKGDKNREPLDSVEKVDTSWLIKQGFNTDVWHIQPETQLTEYHEAPFPEEYAELVIKLYSSKGEIILDPFLGSGTVLLVCKNLRRNGIGYEVNPKYCELSKYRIGFSQSSLAGDQHFFMKSLGVNTNITILTKCVKCKEETAGFVDKDRVVVDCEKCGNSYSKTKSIWFEYNSLQKGVIIIDN